MTYVATEYTQDNVKWTAHSGNSYFTRQRWDDGTIQLSQKVQNLQEGTYELKAYASAWGSGSATLYIAKENGDSYPTLVTIDDSDPGTWREYTLRFSVIGNEVITIGFTTNRKGNSFKSAYDDFTLTYLGIDKSKLNTLIQEANALYQEETTGAPALKSAIDAAQEIANKADASQGEVSSAEEALAAAIKQYPFDNATPKNPLDLTSYIKNPTMETATDWTWTGDIQNKALATNKTGVAIDGAFTGNFYEGWNRSKYTGGLSQTINGLVSGIYRLKAGAFNEAATESGVYLYGNEYETAVTSSNPMFYTVDIYVNNGTLTIGLRSDNNTTNWLGLDNVSLSYIGYDVMTVMDLINGTINEALSLSNEKNATRDSRQHLLCHLSNTLCLDARRDRDRYQ